MSLSRRLDTASRAEVGSEDGEASAFRDKDRARGAPRIKRGKAWDVLVSQGKINEEHVQQALEVQKKDSRELGKILVSLGFISELDLAQAQAQRLGLDFVDLSERDVDPGAFSLIPEKVLRKHKVVPLRIENKRLLVAMSDPANIYALDDLKLASGYRIAPVVATSASIQHTQTKMYAVGEQVTEMLEEAAEDAVEDPGALDLGLQTSPDDSPTVQLVNSILQRAAGEGASDIHIEPRSRELTVRFRVDGELREVMSIPQKFQSQIIARLKILASLDIAERRLPQDGRFSIKLADQKVDLRVASLPTVYGEKVALRLLDASGISAAGLTNLGLAPYAFERYEKIFRRPYGMILVTGPTGSGKSTTLYATLNELNSPKKNIITVEDPVEYRMQGINQIQTNPKAGLTFASALRSILRADPDILMIGEIRDFETAKIAVESALTGHMVLATLHTNDAPGALTRLTDMGVEPFLTSSAVDCVVAQRLARRLCENCKEPVIIKNEILAGIQFPFEYASENGLHFHKAIGCEMCGGTGYRGRVGIYELMVVTEKMREMVLRRVSAGEIGSAAREEGMLRLREDGLLKAAQGLTAIEEVFRTAV
jgi:type IV pilus assembly protein PilB